jgi:hypothetical protein
MVTMFNRRLVLLIWLLTGCLLSGCVRSGVNARAVAPVPMAGESESSVTQVKTAADNAEVAAAQEAPPFRFPDDRGGQLLSKVLAPDVSHSPVERSTEPRRPPATATIESPTVPMPAAPVGMPRLPIAKGNNTLKPRLLLPETLDGSPSDPRLPQVPVLPTGELTRVPSTNVNQPVPLPLLGQPLSDRAPVEDVTAEASAAAVVEAKVSLRTQPTPFVKNNLPDPFEFRRPVVAPAAPAEQPTPLADTPKLPKP